MSVLIKENFYSLNDDLKILFSCVDFELSDRVMTPVKKFARLYSLAKSRLLILLSILNNHLIEENSSELEEDNSIVLMVRKLHEQLADLTAKGNKGENNQEALLTKLVDAFNQFIFRFLSSLNVN